MSAANVDHFFGIPGHSILDILDEIRGRSEFRFILNRHEQGSSYMAYGFSRASRRPSVCMATSGPGATNLVSGVAAAYKAAIPMIAITGMDKRHILGIGGPQQFDQVALYAPITKWSHMAASAEELPHVMRKAFQIALQWPPGPVHLSFPSDILRQSIEDVSCAPAAYEVAPTTWDRHLVAKIASNILEAKSPLLIAGRELLWQGAVGKVVELAEYLQIPVATTMDNPDSFPNTHPLGLGPVGPFQGWDPANKAIANADLILTIGVRFDMDLTGTVPPRTLMPRAERLIQVNCSEERIGHVFPVDIGAVGHLGDFASALLAQLKRMPRREATPSVQNDKREWYARREAEADQGATPVKAAYVAQTVRRVLERDAILVPDIGTFFVIANRYLDTFEPDTFHFAENFAAVGSAFPMSLGVKLAKPSAQVVCLTGDGGLGMNLSELVTAVREKIKVTVIVFNDFGYGLIRSYQKNAFGSRLIGTEFGGQDFAKLAEGYGALGLRVTEPGELAAALELALASDVPAVVDVNVDRRDFGAD